MRPLRLFLFWLLSFIATSLLNFLAVFAWSTFNYNNLFLAGGMVATPLVVLLFGWLYFRPSFAVKLSQQIKNATFWIALDFLANLIVLGVLSGVNSLDAFSSIAIVIEFFNFTALIVAARVSLRPELRSVPAWLRSSVPPRPEQE